MGPRDRFKEASGSDFEYSSYIQSRLKVVYFSLYLCLAQRLKCSLKYILYHPHSHLYVQ